MTELVFTQAEDGGTERAESENSSNKSESDDKFYEMSFWSPCSRTCGIGVKFRGKRCIR